MFVLIDVEIANASQFVGIGFVGIETFEDNDLVGLDPCGFVDGSRIKTSESEIAFCSGHKKCQGLLDHIKASKIEIPSIDDVKGARFEDQLIQDGHIVNLPVGNNDKGRDASAQVQKGVQFYCSLALSEFGPWKKRKAEIDRGGVQSISGLIQCDSKGIVGIKTSRVGNKDLSKVRVDPPISYLVGMS